MAGPAQTRSFGTLQQNRSPFKIHRQLKTGRSEIRPIVENLRSKAMRLILPRTAAGQLPKVSIWHSFENVSEIRQSKTFPNWISAHRFRSLRISGDKKAASPAKNRKCSSV